MYGRFTQDADDHGRGTPGLGLRQPGDGPCGRRGRDSTYGRKHYAIRTKYHKGLLLGRPFMRPLADDGASK